MANQRLDKVLTREKNKIRGVLSQCNSNGYRPGLHRGGESKTRSGLKDVLLSAREKLSPNQFGEFLEWTQDKIDSTPGFVRETIGYDELWGVHEANDVGLGVELEWVASRLSVLSNRISSYLDNKLNIEREVLKNNPGEAIRLQDIQFDKFGASMHGVQLRIALETMRGGIDSQKNYSSKVRSQFKSGLLSFVGFYSSARNEPQSNIGSYLSAIKLRIRSNKSFSEEVKDYLSFTLTQPEFFSEIQLANVLKVEQSHSIVDLYETFIRVCQYIVVGGFSKSTQYSVYRALKKCTRISDVRLAKLRENLDGSSCLYQEIPLRNGSLLDYLLMGRPCSAIRQYKSDIFKGEIVDSWAVIYAAFAYSNFSVKPKDRPLSRELPYLLGRILSECEETIDAIDDLIKKLINYRGLFLVDGILDFLNILKSSGNSPVIDFYPLNIRSAYRGPEEECYESKSKTLSVQAWSQFYRNSNLIESSNLGCQNSEIFKVLSLYNSQRYKEALEWLGREVTTITRSVVTSLSLRCYVESGVHGNVINMLASLASENQTASRLVAINYATSCLTKEDLRASDEVSALIVLYLKWLHSKSEVDASNLRIFMRVIVRKLGLNRPSEIGPLVNDKNRNQVIYMLRDVCRIEFIEGIKSINCTLHELEERHAICQLLRKIDPANDGVYSREIAEIDYRKKLEEGEFILDRTRIHVDGEALQRWCRDNILEDFLRYQSLVDLDSTSESSVTEYLKELYSGNLSNITWGFRIETEADQLLITMIMEVVEQFLKNPVFGLDFHLSKRIRHQSFIGLVRGPAEKFNLITTKKKDNGEYKSNRYYLKKFDRLDQKNKEHIDKAFKKFSKSFDEKLIEAKDSYFQIYSPRQHPKGIIKLNVTEVHVGIIKKMLSKSSTLEDFVEIVEQVLWGVLEPSLKESRNFITDMLSRSLKKSFDDLRGQISSRVEHESDSYMELSKAISEGYNEVSNMLVSACAWFTRLSATSFENKFRLREMVEIAISKALEPMVNFNPDIELNVEDEDTLMDPYNTVEIHDVVFVALGNIFKHSGLTTPKVTIGVSIDSENETFTIIVTNEVAYGIRSSSESRLLEVAGRIKKKDYEERTRRESRSGLIKLAAVAHQDYAGEVTARFVEDDLFEMKVVYVMFIRKE